MDPLPPIPTPSEQRWREFRIQILPIIVFAGVLAAIVMMWKSFLQPPGVIEEVHAVKANVTLPEGVRELRMERAQYVTNGQALALVQEP
jgi:hypothetical protein